MSEAIEDHLLEQKVINYTSFAVTVGRTGEASVISLSNLPDVRDFDHLWKRCDRFVEIRRCASRVRINCT